MARTHNQTFLRPSTQQTTGAIQLPKERSSKTVIRLRWNNGEHRMFIDYGDLYARTFQFPMSFIEYIVDRVGGKVSYLTFDFACGYFRTPITRGASKKSCAYHTGAPLITTRVLLHNVYCLAKLVDRCQSRHVIHNSVRTHPDGNDVQPAETKKLMG